MPPPRDTTANPTVQSSVDKAQDVAGDYAKLQQKSILVQQQNAPTLGRGECWEACSTWWPRGGTAASPSSFSGIAGPHERVKSCTQPVARPTAVSRRRPFGFPPRGTSKALCPWGQPAIRKIFAAYLSKQGAVRRPIDTRLSRGVPCGLRFVPKGHARERPDSRFHASPFSALPCLSRPSCFPPILSSACIDLFN